MNNSGKPLLLLVEDNADDEMIALRALGKSDVPHRVEVVHDGQQAIDFMGKPDEMPSLVLLDLKMPRVSGLEVLKSIRSGEATRKVPVVIFTSSALESDILDCYDNGANAYVRKAHDLDEYFERMRLVARFWLEVNERCS